MIVINWDWFSFFAGIFASVTIAFWAVLYLGFRQWKRGRDAAKDSDAVLAKWMRDGKL